ncbi:hypothetical protein CC78DRAFT_587069 [Lojkania enalia]|uniref:Zn(2)-C6 fungal-type domain-containing protein n=1 Tax=Lojkania enalia TaxID=147567 RepID=A0A9P4MXP8_9PLEO|nr:hypothetical protein CC78DRAFT_587069 [Didymosphaeria enalia]
MADIEEPLEDHGVRGMQEKEKCYMRESRPPCAQCKKRNLSCMVTRSLQMLLEGDTLVPVIEEGVNWSRQASEFEGSAEEPMKIVVDSDSGQAAASASCISQTVPSQPPVFQDIISRGIIIPTKPKFSSVQRLARPLPILYPKRLQHKTTGHNSKGLTPPLNRNMYR